MKISVIIPIYNAEATLQHCIDSLLCQTFKDFELILVDDCSKDSSRQLMEYYKDKDHRIKCLFASCNGGGSATRNLGLAEALGEFVMFADSDDFVTPDWMERLYNAQIVNSNSLVMSNIYDFKGGSNLARIKNFREDQIVTEDYFKIYSQFHLDGYLWNKIFERSVIEQNQLKFNTQLKEGEDVDFIFRYIHCKGIINFCLIEKPLYYYWRDNEQSVTNSYNPNALGDNLHCFEYRFPYVSQENRTEFCDMYFSYLYSLFDNVFDKRSNRSFLEAMAYNHRVLKSSSFRLCLENSNQGNSDILLVRIVKSYNYYLIWLFQRLLLILK